MSKDALYTKEEVDFSLKKTMHPKAGAVITYLAKNGTDPEPDPTKKRPWLYRFPPVENPGDLPDASIDPKTGRLYEGCHEYLKSPYFYDMSTNILFVDESDNSIWKWELDKQEYIKCNSMGMIWHDLDNPV